jgi:hypothetical protein
MVKLHFLRSLVICGGMGISLICIANAQGPPENSNWLTSGKLTSAGLHLPSYMPTVGDQIGYQTGLPTHQELSIQWNSMPGVTAAVVKKQDVQNSPVSSNFVILSRKHSLKGTTETRPPMLVNDELVVAAATSSGEIRGLIVIWDPRASHTENVSRQQKIDLLEPNVTFTLSIPDDPQIRRVIFLQPVAAQGGGAALNSLGEVPLPDDRSTKGPVSP